MRLRQLLLMLLGSSIFSHGQLPYNQQENFLRANSVWAFGYNAGVNFNTASPTAIETEVAVGEGTASVADPITGQLLFYSDGKQCWDGNHQLMPNGDNLWGNQASTTQGVCIVPVIDSPGKYYLFSLFGPTQYGSSTSPAMLAYSIIDMSLNSGMGDIVNGQKNIVLSNDSLSESMIAIPGDNCDLWLMVHEYRTPVFRAYHITETGLDTVPVVSNGVGQVQGVLAYHAGQMAVSPDRSKVAIASFNGGGYQIGAVLAQFDAVTGQVSNALTVSVNEECYGICFSPDNSKLYVSGLFQNGSGGPPVFRSHVRQYDISVYDSAAIVSSAQLIDSSVQRNAPSCLKLYDGKIYRLYQPDGWAGLLSGQLGLSCINDPDLSGAACNDDAGNVIPFLAASPATLTLPNDVVYPSARDTSGQLVLDTAFCGGTTIALEGSTDFAGYLWDDGSVNQVREVSQSGTYWVLNEDRCHSRVDTFVVEVYAFITPVISVDGFILSTTASYATYQWLLNGTAISGATQSEYTVSENGDYQVMVSTTDGCSDTSAIYEVTNVTGIYSISAVSQQVKIYPNPTNDILQISAPVPVNVSLCSIEGRILKYLPKASRISLSDVVEGIYLLRIYDQEGRLFKTEKIVKAL